ncbi:MAG: hypothetical protein JWR07_2134, partial [Nevskia sp.]|nr:hypothetical protein [Nevskia sp.]
MPTASRHWLMLLLLLACVLAAPHARADDQATLMRFPTLHGDTVVFEAHGNLWQVNRAGGTASRLTAEPGYELMPRYSPDGKWIAFTGQYQGNRDVYVIPAGGGAARRLTFHSDITAEAPTRWGPDNMVVGWTPDSKDIIFLSRRDSRSFWVTRLYTVPVEGGMQRPLPLDRAGLLSYSPDGKQIAYNRIFRNFRTWKRYQGGLGQDLFTYDFDSKKLSQITDWPGTETAPMWYGHTIYFLSDHDHQQRENIWAYDLETHQFREVTHFTDYDADFPSLGDNGIVFQQGGKLYVLDLPSEQLHPLETRVPDDGVHTGPRFVDARKSLRDSDAAQQPDYDLAPNGKRALFTARGDLFSVPAEHGATRNLTASPGADDDHPAWSPDGTRVAYTTDSGGEQQIAVRPAEGGEEKILTHFHNGFYYQPMWAPGGDKLAFSDHEHRLWLLDLAGGEPRQVAQDQYQEIHDYSWSPDGRWLAYSLTGPNQVHAIWFYSLDSGKATRVSAARDNDLAPIFDAEGKHLYFISTRHENPVFADNEMNIALVKSSGVYVTTLAADAASPFAPQSDEGAVAGAGKDEGDDGKHGKDKSGDAKDGDGKPWKPAASAPIHLDLEGLMQRAVPLPVPAANIVSLDERKGKVYYFTQPLTMIDGRLPGEKAALHVFDTTERKDAVVVEELDGYRLAADGGKVLYKKDKDFFIVDAKADAGKDAKPLDLAHMRLRIEPRQEWREMFDTAWRLQRDLLFNSKMNGVDWNAVHASYSKLLPLLGSREDLNYLIGELIGELSNSHTYVFGGDQDNPVEPVPTGLLGVDFGLDAASGRYYFATIYPGDNTREEYRSPLTQPGLKVKQGDFLLAVDGQELKAPADPYSLFVGKDQGTVKLAIAESAGGKRRDVVVQPVKKEVELREQAWIEHNRALVDKLSDGRIGYVYLSDMDARGM